jgi:hypothetical protein
VIIVNGAKVQCTKSKCTRVYSDPKQDIEGEGEGEKDESFVCYCSCSCPTHVQECFTSNGRKVAVVQKYKYLGIWFNWNLNWDDHIKYMIGKSKSRSASLRRLLTNNRIVPRAKTLVWLCFVRPLLDYGCEVWQADNKQAAALESIQTQAGNLIFKLNTKTKTLATRALMKCTSLSARRERYRLRYLVRYVLDLPEVTHPDTAPEPWRSQHGIFIPR